MQYTAYRKQWDTYMPDRNESPSRIALNRVQYISSPVYRRERTYALYAVSVRRAKGLPPASLKLRLTTDALAFSYVLPATGRTRVFHPLDSGHVVHTHKRCRKTLAFRHLHKNALIPICCGRHRQFRPKIYPMTLSLSSSCLLPTRPQSRTQRPGHPTASRPTVGAAPVSRASPPRQAPPARTRRALL